MLTTVGDDQLSKRSRRLHLMGCFDYQVDVPYSLLRAIFTSADTSCRTLSSMQIPPGRC